MRISGLDDLFTQHCLMPTFMRKQHATAVDGKLKEAMFALNKKAKKCLLKDMATLMAIMTVTINASPQRVDKPSTSEVVL